LETRFLETFVLVSETSSVAEAARRLNVTPSAVLQRIRALEAEIGAPLVRRAGHSTRLTAAGLAILDRAEALIAGARDLKVMAGGDAEAGELRIGAINTALTGILPPILDALTRNRPQLDLYVLPGVSADLHRKVSAGELDAAVLVRPHFNLSKELDFMLLRQEPLILLAPAALAGSEPRALLTREPFIRYDRNHWGGRLADLYLRREKIRPRDRYELDSLEAIAVLVDRGLGISVIPDWTPPWPEGLSVAKIGLPHAPSREIGLLWSRTSPRQALVRAVIDEAARSSAVG
jgi:DNA-binding transcriptional LysR family regulator